MPTITIDGRAVEVADGATVLAAARQIGIQIPTICFGGNGCTSSASCLVCAVKLSRTGQMIPSCAVQVADGMEVESQTLEVEEVRRAAVELLLSDHVGDCISLCSQSCPAHADIAAMLRQVRAGRFADAVAVAKQHLALPATLGRVCHRPCQRPCRRKTFDAPVAIGQIERCVADQDLASQAPYLPGKAEPTGRRVAIVGGGPTGLSAAWHLLLRGHDCTLFDERETAGGSLFDEFPADVLPPEVVAAEAELIRRFGARFELGGPRVDAARLEQLLADFDAVLCAVGRVRSAEVAQLGLATGLQGIGVNRFLQTSRQRVFAAGQAARRTGRRVHSVAHGRMAAIYLDQFLCGAPLVRQVRPFSSHVKCLRPEEMQQFMAVADPTPRGPAGAEAERLGLTREEAVREAGRCCRCDCRKADTCRLRQAAEQLGARRNRYAAPRREVERPRRSFLGDLRARQVYSLRKLPARGGESPRAVGAGLRGSRVRRAGHRTAGRRLVGGPSTGRARVRGSLPYRRLGPQIGKRSGRGELRGRALSWDQRRNKCRLSLRERARLSRSERRQSGRY